MMHSRSIVAALLALAGGACVAAEVSDEIDSSNRSERLDEHVPAIDKRDALRHATIENPRIHERFVRPLPYSAQELHVFTLINDDGDKQVVALDRAGAAVALDDAMRENEAARSSACGKLHGVLCQRIHDFDTDRTIPVVVWVDFDEEAPNRELMDTSPAAYRAAFAAWRSRLAQRVAAVAEQARSRGTHVRQESTGGPWFIAETAAGRVHQIEELDGVVSIDTDYGWQKHTLASSLSRNAWNNYATANGTNVRAGLSEPYCPAPLSNYPPIDFLYYSPSLCGYFVGNVQYGIFANTMGGTTPPGYGSDALIHAAWDGAEALPHEDLDFFLTKNTRTHGQSWEFWTVDYQDTGIGDRDRYLDYLTRNYALFFVTSAGNEYPWSPDPGVVRRKGYNILTVGATYDDGSIVDGTQSECGESTWESAWKNPTVPTEQELPHLVANGNCITVNGETLSGTSTTVPMLNGMAAGLMEQNTSLQSWPEAVKAILMASPIRIPTLSPDGCPWRTSGVGCADDDGKDGTGLVNGLRALSIGSATAKYRNNLGGARHGHDFAWINKDSFDPSTHELTFSHYAKGFASCNILTSRLRVVTAWDSQVSCGTGGTSCSDILKMDLDIKVYEMPGNFLVGQSSTVGNAYEHADIVIRNQFGSCTPSGTNWHYKIKVKLANYTSLTSSDSTYFAVAWNNY